MSGLVLPRHVAANVRAAREAAAATALKANNQAKYRYDSDDFVSRAAVEAQLADLAAYVAQRREEYPEFTLPRPAGWRICLLMLTIPETSEGGVIMVDDTREARAVSSPQGIVLSLGPSAYSDPARFIDGRPWVQVGDRIVFVKYDVTMFKLSNGQTLGYANDTQPVGVLDGGWEVPA